MILGPTFFEVRGSNSIVLILLIRIFPSDQKHSTRNCIKFADVIFLVANVDSRKIKKESQVLWHRIKEFDTYRSYRGPISWNHTISEGVLARRFTWAVYFGSLCFVDYSNSGIIQAFWNNSCRHTNSHGCTLQSFFSWFRQLVKVTSKFTSKLLVKINDPLTASASILAHLHLHQFLTQYYMSHISKLASDIAPLGHGVTKSGIFSECPRRFGNR